MFVIGRWNYPQFLAEELKEDFFIAKGRTIGRGYRFSVLEGTVSAWISLKGGYRFSVDNFLLDIGFPLRHLKEHAAGRGAFQGSAGGEKGGQGIWAADAFSGKAA